MADLQLTPTDNVDLPEAPLVVLARTTTLTTRLVPLTAAQSRL